MANNCCFNMAVKGTKENVREFVARMQRDYLEGKHFFRIFSCDVFEEYDTEDGLYIAKMNGDCAWSVYSCMWKGEYTYFKDGSNDKNGVNIEDTCKELQLEWKCESEEPGMGFRENMHIKNGEVLVNECIDYFTVDID